MEDTIAAISTALGVGAISIVRVSGSDALDIVNRIWDGKDLKKVPTHTIHYGHIIEEDKIVDEVLVTVMLSPRTFTTENIVEINCHGGIATTNKVLELLLLHGCRLAEPGEFTKRAFLNGRIDLTEAEGVMDLISAKTDQSRDLAINQVSGKVSNMIRNLRQSLVEIIANIEVNIDYPEYEDIEQLTTEKILPMMSKVREQMHHILKNSENGRIVKEGIKTSIIGRPNVGKSSLLNQLLEEDKAIVTDIAGTTRDIVEGTVNIDGVLLHMIDTAGIRKTDDIVEKIGVEKSLSFMEESDLVLFVLNGNEVLNDEDLTLLKKLKESQKNYIVIVNKTDLQQKIDITKIDVDHIIYMSALKNTGMEELKNKIKELFGLEKIETSDMTYLTNARSIAILKRALQSLNEVEDGIKNQMPIDMVEIDIKNIWNLLGEIIGESYEEELIDQLFSQFCLGK